MLPATITASNGEGLQKQSAKKLQFKFNMWAIPVIDISYIVKSAIIYFLIAHTFRTKYIYLRKKWEYWRLKKFCYSFC